MMTWIMMAYQTGLTLTPTVMASLMPTSFSLREKSLTMGSPQPAAKTMTVQRPPAGKKALLPMPVLRKKELMRGHALSRRCTALSYSAQAAPATATGATHASLTQIVGKGSFAALHHGPAKRKEK